MKKIFISQPMSGLTAEMVLSERKKAKASAEEYLGEEVYLLDSYFTGMELSTHEQMYYLGRAIELMSEADVVFFAKGWERSKGCIVEYEVAKQYSIPRIFMGENKTYI